MNIEEVLARRATIEALAARQRPAPPGVKVQRLKDQPGCPTIMLFAPPPNAMQGDGVVVWFHGGGFVTGSIATHSRIAARLAATLQRPVALVGYRLAPEHPFPAAVDDACRAVERFAGQGPVILGGDSAGANLALGASFAKVAEVFALLLAYPFLDLRLQWPQNVRASYAEDWERLDAYRALYLAGASPHDPSVSPALRETLPVPLLVIATAESDPLSHEAHAFARDMARTGVRVIENEYPHTDHGFMLRDEPTRSVDSLMTDFASALDTQQPRTEPQVEPPRYSQWKGSRTPF